MVAQCVLWAPSRLCFGCLFRHQTRDSRVPSTDCVSAKFPFFSFSHVFCDFLKIWIHSMETFDPKLPDGKKIFSGLSQSLPLMGSKGKTLHIASEIIFWCCVLEKSSTEHDETESQPKYCDDPRREWETGARGRSETRSMWRPESDWRWRFPKHLFYDASIMSSNWPRHALSTISCIELPVIRQGLRTVDREHAESSECKVLFALALRLANLQNNLNQSKMHAGDSYPVSVSRQPKRFRRKIFK
jgi:hypothetical protein